MSNYNEPRFAGRTIADNLSKLTSSNDGARHICRGNHAICGFAISCRANKKMYKLAANNYLSSGIMIMTMCSKVSASDGLILKNGNSGWEDVALIKAMGTVMYQNLDEDLPLFHAILRDYSLA